MKKLFTLASVAIAAASLVQSAHAQQLPIVGGFTSVQLSETFLSYEPTVTAIGSTLLSPGSNNQTVAYFPITAGSIDTISFLGDIQHIGSGLSISKGVNSVQLTDFIINTGNDTLFANVTYGFTQLGTVALFSIGLSGVPSAPFSLQLSQQASDVLYPLLTGINDGGGSIAGVTFGLANTLPITAAVPEPSTYALLLAGLCVVGRLSARRRSA